MDLVLFAGGPLKISYFRKRFCTISPFSLIASGKTSHHVLSQNKFLHTGCLFNLALSQKSAMGGAIMGSGGGAPSAQILQFFAKTT